MRIRTAILIVAASGLAAACNVDVNANEKVPKPGASNLANAARERGRGAKGAGEVVGAGAVALGGRGGGLTGGYQVVYAQPGYRVRPPLGRVVRPPLPLGVEAAAGPLGGGTTGTGPAAGPIAGGTRGHGAGGGGTSAALEREGRPTVSDEANLSAALYGFALPPAGPGGLAPATVASREAPQGRILYGKVAWLVGDRVALRIGGGELPLRLADGARVTARGWPVARRDVAPGVEARASLDAREGEVVALEVAGPTPLGP